MKSPEFRGAVKFWTDMWLHPNRRISPYTGNLTYPDYKNMLADNKVLHWTDGSGEVLWGNGWHTKLYPHGFDFSTVANFSTNRLNIAMMKNPRGV
ncbi:hypothetical protein M427DRAFT_317317 [Gonapodya prolifera JEL478]|uniref:Uncharacterized protein n=1 Tax=Gonapodya prolifera (strain JEL478) TaxID=1344416 RepID=A0A139AXB2_GONPJ|nr:hypothetical protein M427DRAFT_317317 [Gonapodya prolifera JEL478]|eukprot:KXS21344.1 hypothetical protein M427DRAFT_317317 [Gonapodya prolifera JEL478]